MLEKQKAALRRPFGDPLLRGRQIVKLKADLAR
jgi:hypothetical protein